MNFDRQTTLRAAVTLTGIAALHRYGFGLGRVAREVESSDETPIGLSDSPVAGSAPTSSGARAASLAPSNGTSGRRGDSQS